MNITLWEVLIYMTKLTMGEVRNYLEQGKTPQDIQKITGASETVVKAHLTRLKNAGIKAGVSSKPRDSVYSFNTLDEAIEFWVGIMMQAKKVPSLEKLVDELTKEVSRLREEKSQLSQVTTQEAEKRYEKALP